MKAELLLRERHQLGVASFAELRVWRVPRQVRGSAHRYKFALAYVVNDECVLRYDNEAGKGDHRHVGSVEMAYDFVTPERLIADFWRDVRDWKPG